MHRSNLSRYLAIFIAIWSTWSIWNSIQPLLTIFQLTTVFLFLPISALLIAFSFLDDDKDDDDSDGGLLEPIIIQGELTINIEDELIGGCLISHKGLIRYPEIISSGGSN